MNQLKWMAIVFFLFGFLAQNSFAKTPGDRRGPPGHGGKPPFVQNDELVKRAFEKHDPKIDSFIRKQIESRGPEGLQDPTFRAELEQKLAADSGEKNKPKPTVVLIETTVASSNSGADRTTNKESDLSLTQARELIENFDVKLDNELGLVRLTGRIPSDCVKDIKVEAITTPNSQGYIHFRISDLTGNAVACLTKNKLSCDKRACLSFADLADDPQYQTQYQTRMTLKSFSYESVKIGILHHEVVAVDTEITTDVTTPPLTYHKIYEDRVCTNCGQKAASGNPADQVYQNGLGPEGPDGIDMVVAADEAKERKRIEKQKERMIKKIKSMPCPRSGNESEEVDLEEMLQNFAGGTERPGGRDRPGAVPPSDSEIDSEIMDEVREELDKKIEKCAKQNNTRGDRSQMVGQQMNGGGMGGGMSMGMPMMGMGNYGGGMGNYGGGMSMGMPMMGMGNYGGGMGNYGGGMSMGMPMMGMGNYGGGMGNYGGYPGINQGYWSSGYYSPYVNTGFGSMGNSCGCTYYNPSVGMMGYGANSTPSSYFGSYSGIGNSGCNWSTGNGSITGF